MKIINMKHSVCDYTCMWNGLEDVYRERTGNELPPNFFFGLSAFCSPLYLKTSKGGVPRAMYFNAGLPKKMYGFMGSKIGFSYSSIENSTFKYALNKAKNQIDRNNVLVVGALDMYHLEYHYKFYHKFHIPIHYILMVGYDDAKKQIYLFDCGKFDMQILSYENLEKAWNVNVPGLSKKNTLFTFDFENNLNNVKSIFYKSLKSKVDDNLHLKVNFIGVKAFDKLAKEIGKWNLEVSSAEYKNCLLHLVEYTGFPPIVPDECTMPDNNHNGARFQFSQLLLWGSKMYDEAYLEKAAIKFMKSGKLIEQLSTEILKCVNHTSPISSDIIALIKNIGLTEKKAYEYIENCFK
ncbi:MAG: hypothetical protein ACI8WT_002431 [Clostridium sp.]|jgi:hypothetical protein